ncbi:MAG: response regulator [Syntrophaceae bacterium]|nr:response regulator [Syntrophaceae bacterium]
MKDARILIVDDEPPIRAACAKILAEQGASVETGENGLAGLEKAKAQEFDLALIDLKMPQMDGMQLLESLNRLDPDLVKIVITGFATLDTAIEAVQKGAYDYLPKPFTPGELRTRVKRGLEKRTLLREAKRLREERERNLLELANEKSRTQTIIQFMGDGLLVTNRDRQVVLCNPAARRLLKIKRPLQAGEPLTSVASCPDFIELVEKAMVLENDQEMTSREIPPPSPSDPVLMANCAPVKDEKGQIIGVVTVLRDITELKALDKAKSTFVSLVAHELQAPLAAIEGYLDIILDREGLEAPEKTRKILERCRDRASGLLALIHDLLAISRMESARTTREKEKLRLSGLLKEVMELIKGKALERGVEMIADLPEDLPSISANREDLTRVFTNLMDNAIKYNRQGGKVFLRAKAVDDFLRVEVQDTGIGIPPEERGKIFDEFYRVKSKATQGIGGTGLGLSIAKKILEAHHGHLEVESVLHEGSTFRVLLPV